MNHYFFCFESLQVFLMKRLIDFGLLSPKVTK
ncbi:Uncharacterised protein [Salmonella enterica subsp. arizonae]|uniref:Uncharacterized protein n=1 Tax=Salmonella enterica subsp. arizonae TaxID=59203 RepID=A0A379T069_SALER|nr:Uncharacterised protein [Salmonella enterica subsp. arizonae]